jgi:hypothetical protein
MSCYGSFQQTNQWGWLWCWNRIIRTRISQGTRRSRTAFAWTRRMPLYSPHSHTLLLLNLPYLQTGLFPYVFRLRFYAKFSCVPCVLHSMPTSPSLFDHLNNIRKYLAYILRNSTDASCERKVYWRSRLINKDTSNPDFTHEYRVTHFQSLTPDTVRKANVSSWTICMFPRLCRNVYYRHKTHLQSCIYTFEYFYW